MAIREALEERGVVNGQVADPEKLDNDPFIQRVLSDAEQIAAAEIEQTSEVSISDEEYEMCIRDSPLRCRVHERDGWRSAGYAGAFPHEGSSPDL